jgi:hypothetical protein
VGLDPPALGFLTLILTFSPLLLSLTWRRGGRGLIPLPWHPPMPGGVSRKDGVVSFSPALRTGLVYSAPSGQVSASTLLELSIETDHRWIPVCTGMTITTLTLTLTLALTLSPLLLSLTWRRGDQWHCLTPPQKRQSSRPTGFREEPSQIPGYASAPAQG